MPRERQEILHDLRVGLPVEAVGVDGSRGTGLVHQGTLDRPAAGTVAPGADLKLRSAGLDPARFCVGAYGSDSARRADLPAVAAARATALTGASFAGSDVIIVGDTPDDVACGRPIGARSLAVATGSYGVAELRATGAAYVFETLANTALVLDAIFA